MPAPDQRFDSKWVEDPVTGCHIWTRGKSRGGYGTFRPNGRSVPAHCFAYTRKYGPVPDGKILDHFKCDNRGYCNPDHVRPVTRLENALRSHTSIAAKNAAKTHCVNGHEFDEGNTRYRADGTGRHCHQCRLASSRRQKQRRRDAAKLQSIAQ